MATTHPVPHAAPHRSLSLASSSEDRSGPFLRPAERAALTADRWFASLPAALRHDLLRHAHVRRHGHGERIAVAGEPVGEWLACAAGSIQLAATSAEGRAQTLDYVPPGEWLGEPGLFDGGLRLHDATAQGETTTLSIPRPRLEVLWQLHPDLPLAMLRLQAARLRHLVAALEESRYASVRERLTRQLLHLARTHGADAAGEDWLSIRPRLQQEQLAHLIGSTRQRVNMELKAMEREGILRVRRGVLLWRAREPAACCQCPAGDAEARRRSVTALSP